MSTLKAVKIEFDFVMVVGDASKMYTDINKAQDYARDALSDMSNRDLLVTIRDYTPGSVSEWDEGCIPYGGDGEKETRDYMDAANDRLRGAHD